MYHDKKYFCNTTVKEPVLFYIPVTYEMFISDIVLNS